MIRTERTSLLTVLCLFSAVVLTACASQSGVEERRQRLTEREATSFLGGEGLDEDLPPLDEGSGADRAVRELAADEDFLGGEAEDVVNEAVEDSKDDLDDLVASDESDAGKPRRAARRDRREASSDRVADVLETMRLDAQALKEGSKYSTERGDDAFGQKLYAEAAKHYREALDDDPGNTQARRGLRTSQLILNERSGEVPSVANDVFEKERVKREQNRVERDRSLNLATDSFEQGNLDDAERYASIALDTMQTSPDLSDENIVSEARSLLRRIANRRVEIEDSERKRRVAVVDDKVERELAEEKERRRMQVQDLLYKARRHIRRKEYGLAQSACGSILELDPDNKIAIFWRNEASDMQVSLRKLRILDERRENQQLLEKDFIVAGTPNDALLEFPSDEDWARVKKRSREVYRVAIEEPEAVRQVRSRLENQMIQIEFDDTPLSEVVNFFREIAGVNIVIDNEVDAESDEFKVTQPINNLSAMAALRNILETKGLAFTFEENVLKIGSSEDVQRERSFELYDVSDLLTKIRDFAAPEIRLRGAAEGAGEAPISFTDDSIEDEDTLDSDQLIELIRGTTGGEEAWPDETTNIKYNRGQLFVRAPRELHLKLQGVLESLRKDSDLFVVIEARFIDVFDDFLEDIGIDSRALGAVNNLGTPFGNVINDNSTGGNDLGIVEGGNPDNVQLVQGLERWAGRVQHILDGFAGTVRGDRLTAGDGLSGGTFQATWLEPFQVNVILRMVQEKQDVRQLTAPIVTAHNNERVYVSVITQRAYIADYELVSGGTGFAIIEVADPVVQTFQEGVILDVDPTISHDKKYVTLDVRPTLATLIGGVISTIEISLGTFSSVAFQVPIGIPQISLQQAFTSVTVPNGGTVLLGGFKSMESAKLVSFLPILGQIPILKNLARRQSTVDEKRSLVILLSARIVDLRGEEAKLFNPE